MGKLASLFFFAVPIVGVGFCYWALTNGYNFPVDISVTGHRIDHLFWFIAALTGVVFIATEGVLAWFVWRYDGSRNPDAAKFAHGNHNLEVVWTIVPAATLVFIAIYQMNAWADAKMRPPDMDPTVEVTARQFEWRLRYPGADGKLGTRDDVHHVNDLHVPLDTEILVSLKSADVLHSFFLPNLRVKQDAVPGMKIPVWFRAMEPGTYDLVCAELCGWGHYKMKGRLTVESREDFEAWLAKKYQEQSATQDAPAEEAKSEE